MANLIHSDTECPTPDVLADLIRGRLPGDVQAELTEHIGACSGCGRKLEELAVEGDPSLSDQVRHINASRPKNDSAYWRAIGRAESILDEHDSPIPDRPVPPGVKLDFIDRIGVPGETVKLGAFEIVRVLGRGGMGVVLHAHDPRLSRDVAIKILDPLLAGNDIARRRFCREARAAASVVHENIVTVHQVHQDESNGLPYIVMQLIQGESLEQRLKRVGRVSVLEAVRIGAQAAAGLAAAHAQGLIHRDVKPGNIMIDGSVKRNGQTPVMGTEAKEKDSAETQE